MEKYETIQEWLDKDPVNYDFVNDTQGDEPQMDYDEIGSIYEQFLIYKYTGTGKIEWKINDCVDPKKRKGAFINIDKYSTKDPDDSSQLLQKIYKRLWPELAETKYMISKKKICSDTMTSALGRWQDALNAVINSKDSSTDIQKTICTIMEIYKKCGNRQKWWSANFSILVAAALGSVFYDMIDTRYPEVKSFLGKYHTIGNFCPVPKGFNAARSGGGQYDCWDLTLMKIREWYLSVDSKSLYERDNLIQEDLLHNTGNPLKCLRWLESFGQGQIGWHNFVDTLYMQDYVYNEDNWEDKRHKDNKENREYYDVIPFWNGHEWSKEGIKFPTGDDEIKKAFETMTAIIDARSNRIVEALRNAKK